MFRGLSPQIWKRSGAHWECRFFLKPNQLDEKYGSFDNTYSDCEVEDLLTDSSLVNFASNIVGENLCPILSIDEVQIEQKLDDMFKLESLGIKEDISDSDISKIGEFNKGIQFIDGKYHIELPWTSQIDSVDSNFHIAKAVLSRVVDNLIKNNMYDAYEKVIIDQVSDDVLEEVPLDLINTNDHIWITHRPVVKNTEQCTTKIRIVLNCSLKRGNSVSLNQASYPGIDLLNNLLNLLIKIRLNPVLMISDIKQAFLNIKLSKITDRNRFSILWKTKNGFLRAFRYKTIVFGLASSPFILHQVIRYHLSKYPDDYVNQLLVSNMYVDNLFVTGDDVNDMSTLYVQTRQRMA